MAIGAVLAITLAACQTGGGSWATTTIPPERQITLQPGGPHQGESDTGGVVVGYAYQIVPGEEQAIHVRGGVRHMKFRGDSLNIYLNLLDSSGAVLEKKVLFASGNRRNVYFRRSSAFDTTLPLPAGTTAIAFSTYVKPSSGRR